MPVWAWVFTIAMAILGLAVLTLALFRVRYFLEWRGSLDGTVSGKASGTVRLHYGFPGFMRPWNPAGFDGASIADLFDEESDDDKESTQNDDSGNTRPAMPPESGKPPEKFAVPAAESRPSGSASIPVELPPNPPTPPGKKNRDHNRARRALFRLFTDPAAWKLLGRFGLKTARFLLRMLDPRIEVALGHPDPAWLGRLSGKWYAARPLLPFGRRTQVYFRFQDRGPSIWVRAQGTFSALSVLAFGLRLFIAFPSIRLARRALRSWRSHRLSGWRQWVYRRMQAS